MVGQRLVDEATAGRVDGDHAGLGAVGHRMRKDAAAAVGAPEQRGRHPVGRARRLRVERGTGRGREPEPVASAGGAGRRDETSRGREEAFAQHGVVRKAAGREHHAATRGDQAVTGAVADDNAADAIALHRQVLDIGAEEDLDLPRQQRGIEPRRERVAEMQRRAARAAQPLQRVFGNQPRRAQGRTQRFSDPAQMRDVETVDHHPAEQRELRQRRPQPRKTRAQPGAVEARPAPARARRMSRPAAPDNSPDRLSPAWRRTSVLASR